MKKKTINDKNNGEKLTATLGLKNLRVTEQMFQDIVGAAAHDDRTIQNEVRHIIKLGLQKKKELQCRKEE